MLALYLVRPGAKDPRTLVTYKGNRGERLTSLGTQAAGKLADQMAACGIAPDGIYIAPCPAALQTAQVLAHRLTHPRQNPVDVLALSDVLPGESNVQFELRIGRYLAKFRESAVAGSFVFVVDQPVAEMIETAWDDHAEHAPLSLQNELLTVLVRE